MTQVIIRGNGKNRKARKTEISRSPASAFVSGEDTPTYTKGASSKVPQLQLVSTKTPAHSAPQKCGAGNHKYASTFEFNGQKVTIH